MIVQAQDPKPALAPLLKGLGLSRATYYRSRRAATSPSKESPEPLGTAEPLGGQDSVLGGQDLVLVNAPLTPSHLLAPSLCRVPGRALSPQEREAIYQHLYAPRFVDLAPSEIYATLLDEGIYLCSQSTLYRLLKADGADTPRTRARKHTHYAKPELLATGPNQVWSWDITKLKGPATWTYFHLYVIIDVYSRYVVGWMLAYRESQELAKHFIDETLAKHNIPAGQLTLHADRGSAMTSKSVALLLSDLGVVKTHSRPHVSNDNPYSESQFKTLKYRPEFPERFGSIESARELCCQLMGWYNGEHHHGGIALLTPQMVHFGQASLVIERRQACLDQAYGCHPARFVNHAPLHACLPDAVWINPPVPTSLPVAPSLPVPTSGALLKDSSAVHDEPTALRNASPVRNAVPESPISGSDRPNPCGPESLNPCGPGSLEQVGQQQ